MSTPSELVKTTLGEAMVEFEVGSKVLEMCWGKVKDGSQYWGCRGSSRRGRGGAVGASKEILFLASETNAL